MCICDVNVTNGTRQCSKVLLQSRAPGNHSAMKQVTHTLKDGRIEVIDVPVPTLNDRFVLVRTGASVISAGTEKTKIDMGNKGLLQKALARPDLVKQVIKKLKTEGLAKTFGTVNTRLAAANPLGYSSAGTALAVGGLVEGIRPGDRVACGGVGYANHADYAVVPKNLIVKVPDNVSDEEAAFTTLGSIALQGVRLADPKLGETVLVLGLGLLGQMTVQMLRANGCRVLGTDLDPTLITLAQKWGAIGVPVTEADNICRELTAGMGVDAVLVCAGTSSNEPIELCGRITREKGRVVVVGAVRMDIPRDDYFKKEISVVISRSYGPGRYDPNYEEGGNDYPAGYVRFTEQRNMQTVLDLIAGGQLDVKSLITHRFAVDDAVAAYSLIEGQKKEPYLGIVLNYDSGTGTTMPTAKRIDVASAPIDKARIGISMVGAGNYATASLLPPLRDSAEVELRGLMTASGRTAASVAKQFGFGFCGSAISDVLGADTDAVVIATRHNTHADYVCQALRAGKHVWVEKPLALSLEELCEVARALRENPSCRLVVGFNRPFSPDARFLFQRLSGAQSRLMHYRVNAGQVPADSWVNDPKLGGGRLLGEGCHFFDFLRHAAGAEAVSVQVEAAPAGRADLPPTANFAATVSFANGSVGQLLYSAQGSPALPKEHFECFSGQSCGVLSDYRDAEFFRGSNREQNGRHAQDKGQAALLDAFLLSLRGGPVAMKPEDVLESSLLTLAAQQSLVRRQPIQLEELRRSIL